VNILHNRIALHTWTLDTTPLADALRIAREAGYNGVELRHIDFLRGRKAGMSEEAMVENDLTGPFMPHGIGHPLGLQVHDVAGFMQDDTGTHLAAPSKYPYLRCTRILEPRMVLTIEPGIYFIESLLAPWREGQFSKHFNWEKIDALKPFGGIRIEDNVVVHENGIENMTRDLKLA